MQAVTYLPHAERTIRTGENAGRTLDHRNVVDEWRSIDTWSGEGLYRATIDVSRDTPVVVIVQSPGQGPVLGGGPVEVTLGAPARAGPEELVDEFPRRLFHGHLVVLHHLAGMGVGGQKLPSRPRSVRRSASARKRE